MRNSNPEIKIALPDGHLQDDTRMLFHEAGISLKGYDKEARNYRPTIDNRPEIQIKVLRPQEIPHLVERGTYHVGVTGLDWLEETGVKVKRFLDLQYGRVNLVLAISKETKGWTTINDVNDLLRSFWKRQSGLMIATEYMHLTKRFISKTRFYKAKKEKEKVGDPILVSPWSPRKNSKSRVKIVLSYGTTEGKPPDDADAIVDNTTTGETLRENNLKVVDTVLGGSTSWLFANKDCLTKASIRASICHLASTLHQVVIARKFLHIFANIPRYDRAMLRACRVSKLAQHDVTVVQSNRGARIDLLIARDDYDETLGSLRNELKATDIVAIKPQRVARPSRGIDTVNAPYMNQL